MSTVQVGESNTTQSLLPDHMVVKRKREDGAADTSLTQLLYNRDGSPKWYFTPKEAAVLARWCNPGAELPSPSRSRRGIVKLLRLLSDEVKQHCVAPISEFQVGVALLGESGAIYLGVNMEFEGLPLSNAVHGEQCAVSNAIRHGEKRITDLAVNAMPCGHCRQFLNELVYGSLITIHARFKKEDVSMTLQELLPCSFGPGDLDVPRGKEALTPQGLDITWGPSALEGPLHENQALSLVCQQAIGTAYAPHSKSPSAVVIQYTNPQGQPGYVWGVYVESAAYNPSLPPVQGAMIAFLQQVSRDWSLVDHVYVVEYAAEHARIQQTPHAKQFFASVAPGVQVDTVHILPAA